MKEPYRELLQKAAMIVQRARELCVTLHLLNATAADIFGPNTLLYKRGKAGEPIQFGRQVLVFEDAAGFIVKSVLMNRDQCDSGVVIEATKELQKLFNNKVERLSFDRGFHSPENQAELSKIIPHLYY